MTGISEQITPAGFAYLTMPLSGQLLDDAHALLAERVAQDAEHLARGAVARGCPCRSRRRSCWRDGRRFRDWRRPSPRPGKCDRPWPGRSRLIGAIARRALCQQPPGQLGFSGCNRAWCHKSSGSRASDYGDLQSSTARMLRCRYRNFVGITARNLYPHIALGAFMEPWRTAIVEASDGQIRIRGYDVTSLMTERTFTDTIFLLHRSRLPTPPGARPARRHPVRRGRPRRRARRPAPRRGWRYPETGSRCQRRSLPASWRSATSTAAPAPGCMEMIAAGLERAKRESLSLDECAGRVVAETRAAGRRVAGLWSPRAYARSAHAGALRPGAAERPGRRRHPSSWRRWS